MKGLLHYMLLSLRLNFRSKQAMVYGFVFPVIFLFAFWGIYSAENPPLAGELGQLLTVTILSGACFGMPTAMVGERERGIWRRYRLLPGGAGGIVISAMIGRTVIIALAIIMQLLLAHYVCKTNWPAHPFMLAGIFFAVSFAFQGLGLVIAMLADNVPAVQALGQIIFLPMLMIGGVGVKLAVLPNWARHVAAFLPGLYAVDAIDFAIHQITPSGSLPLGFSLLALIVIGAAGCFAGRMMFRWDAGQKMLAPARAWTLLALLAWLAVGMAAEQGGYITFRRTASISATAPSDAPEPRWMVVTDADVARIKCDDLPDDRGTITPVAPSLDHLDEEGARRVGDFKAKLNIWPPGRAADLELRVRNLLLVCSIADLQQDAHEGEIARIIFDRIRQDIPADKLRLILTYISMHPNIGPVPTQLPELELNNEMFDDWIRERIEQYARKLLARVEGKVSDSFLSPARDERSRVVRKGEAG